MIKTIYLDMDGVLDNFDKQADLYEVWQKKEHKLNWAKVNYIGSKFWAEIEPFEQGMLLYHNLLKLCQEHNISLKILSAGPGIKCKEGKIKWLKKYCPEISVDNIIIERKGIDKAKYANNESLLIDDTIKNIDAFNSANGFTFLYENNPDICIEFCQNLM